MHNKQKEEAAIEKLFFFFFFFLTKILVELSGNIVYKLSNSKYDREVILKVKKVDSKQKVTLICVISQPFLRD